MVDRIFATVLFALALGFTCLAHADRSCQPEFSLPDPFQVDAQDVRAILNFVNDLAPLEPGRHANSLDRGFVTIWQKYRPDLSNQAISARIESVGFSRFALRKLRRSRPYPHDVNRLHRAWRMLLEDVQIEDATAVHRARVLAVPADAGSVMRFLRDEFPEVLPNRAALPIYFQKLYRRYLPGEPREFNFGSCDGAVGDGRPNPMAAYRILLAWQSYVFELSGEKLIIPSGPVPNVLPFRSKKIGRVPTDVKYVTNDVKSIIAYLLNRYRHVSVRQPDAMATLLRAFRAEFGLPARPLEVGAEDLRSAYYKRQRYAGNRVLRAWAEIKRDLAESDSQK